MLYIVATPIGNLKDITLRALEVLKQADFVLAEDTRVAKKLLSHYDIRKEVLSYHQHSDLNKVKEIMDLLKQSKEIALITDSGTPGISDPGNKLVEEAVKEGIEVTAVPGPSALTAAASIAGFNMDRFLFLGFLPVKNKRKKFLEKIASSEHPVILYESPYKVIKTLEDLKEIPREIVVCRELTKKFETVCRGKINQVISNLKKYPIKGEFVIIIK